MKVKLHRGVQGVGPRSASPHSPAESPLQDRRMSLYDRCTNNVRSLGCDLPGNSKKRTFLVGINNAYMYLDAYLELVMRRNLTMLRAHGSIVRIWTAVNGGWEGGSIHSRWTWVDPDGARGRVCHSCPLAKSRLTPFSIPCLIPCHRIQGLSRC